VKVSLNLPDWLVVRIDQLRAKERRSRSLMVTLLLERQLLHDPRWRRDAKKPPRGP
jgi:metal-responsive CopG/Arc/MetJ family transcriptional regulator